LGLGTLLSRRCREGGRRGCPRPVGVKALNLAHQLSLAAWKYRSRNGLAGEVWAARAGTARSQLPPGGTGGLRRYSRRRTGPRWLKLALTTRSPAWSRPCHAAQGAPRTAGSCRRASNMPSRVRQTSRFEAHLFPREPVSRPRHESKQGLWSPSNTIDRTAHASTSIRCRRLTPSTERQ
jgi:hypothetical protein